MASGASDGKPSPFSSLPPELWSMVAELLDNHDVFSLHAVSREASANTRFVYGQRLFGLLPLVLSSPQQLARSLEVAKAFGARIRHLTIYVDQVKNPPLDGRSRSYHPQADARRVIEQKTAQLLSQIFYILRRAKNVRLGEIAFVTPHHDFLPRCFEVWMESCGGAEALKVPDRDDHGFMTMALKAMQLNSISVKSVVMGRRREDKRGSLINHCLLPAHLLGRSSMDRAVYASIFRGVEHLQLNLWNEPGRDADAAKFFTLITQGAPKLRSLSLSFEFDDQESGTADLSAFDQSQRIFPRLLFHSTMPKLEDLQLCNAQIAFKDLRVFKEKNGSLKSMALNHCRVTDVHSEGDRKEADKALREIFGLCGGGEQGNVEEEEEDDEVDEDEDEDADEDGD